MNNPIIGQIINSPQRRDAIHVAIAPVIAGDYHNPGEHVAVDRYERTTKAERGPTIGIIDPFLRKGVSPGEICWLFLYPNTVTSLRHEWTHPKFDAIPEPVQVDQYQISKLWLEDIASRCGISYDRMMSAVEEDDYINMGENETYRDVLDNQTAEFNRHCSIVLGKEIKHAYPFSCSC